MFAVEDRELKERKRGESIGSDRLTVNLKGGRKERKSSEMRLLRDYVHPLTHIVRSVHILVTNRPQPSQPISPSVRPYIHPPTLDPLCESSHVPRIRGQGCLSSFVAPSIPRWLARTAHARERGEGRNERTNACVVHTMEPYLTAKSTEER